MRTSKRLFVGGFEVVFVVVAGVEEAVGVTRVRIVVLTEVFADVCVVLVTAGVGRSVLFRASAWSWSRSRVARRRRMRTCRLVASTEGFYIYIYMHL